ncbi:hypothetical protein ATCC90586_004563 [Pythium insidiosum]|nr:hypothetical protein ATCC90586_004563 [Pythium insidiosum]
MNMMLPQTLAPTVHSLPATSTTPPSHPPPPVVAPGRSTTVAIEGKSLFTCSQCGALLKFKPNSTPIRDRVSALRSIPIEVTEGHAAAAVISEIVWEYQERHEEDETEDAPAVWTPVPFHPELRLAPFVSANRGTVGLTIEETIPNRLLSKSHLWLSASWEISRSVSQADEDGWVYAPSLDGFRDEKVVAQEDRLRMTVRRRQHLRKRQTDGSDLSWFQELLDCKSLNSLEADRLQYETFLREFPYEHANGHSQENDSWTTDVELEALEEEERRLQAELSALNVESQQLVAKRRDLWSTGADLEQLIRGTFGEGAFLQHLLGLSRDERQSVGVFSVHASDMLRRLQRYNVCNDVFHIWHDGHFGTINGLRLGRLPTRPVEWVEINAALGQAVLLLATIAERANFDFTRNKLVPRGSFSRVANMYGKEYSLYSDGGMFRRRGFNQALVLFLECVDDAGKQAMKEEPSLKFPYKIQRGKIGDLPISLGNDEQWTKALKYMLTHLKWLLAWVAKRFRLMFFAPTFSESFSSLIGETFCEAQRRQLRYSKISQRFVPGGSAWECDLPTRLIGFSGIGFFEFELLATSMPDDFLYFDEEHPMVRMGHLPPPGADAAITQLRAMYPDIPEIQDHQLPIDETMAHTICSIAVVKTGALFYYRCPNTAVPGSAMWAIVRKAVDRATLKTVPANLATLEPPGPDFGSFDARINEFDAGRPAGSVIRLNEFRVNYLTVVNLGLPATMKSLLMGFLRENGFHSREQVLPDSTDVNVEVLVEDSPALSCSFDTLGRMLNLKMTISGDAYAGDAYDP